MGAVAASVLSTQAFAQATAPVVPVAPAPAASTVQPIVALSPVQQASQSYLPANTEIHVTMNEELTTKDGRIDVGHRFGLTVSQDVKVGDFIVIPRGTPAYGEVTWLTGKGAFGKSGKMEIDLRSIELNGQRIPISGHYRQEGEGNTVATVAGIIAVGVFSAFITGKSARIPQGRELKAFTKENVPVSLPVGYARAVTAVPVAPATPVPPAAVAPVAPTAAPSSATGTGR